LLANFTPKKRPPTSTPARRDTNELCEEKENETGIFSSSPSSSFLSELR
jgi:hypothetical protein